MFSRFLKIAPRICGWASQNPRAATAFTSCSREANPSDSMTRRAFAAQWCRPFTRTAAPMYGSALQAALLATAKGSPGLLQRKMGFLTTTCAPFWRIAQEESGSALMEAA